VFLWITSKLLQSGRPLGKVCVSVILRASKDERGVRSCCWFPIWFPVFRLMWTSHEDLHQSTEVLRVRRFKAPEDFYGSRGVEILGSGRLPGLIGEAQEGWGSRGDCQTPILEKAPRDGRASVDSITCLAWRRSSAAR
jgi:hypothetical protein